MVWGSFFDTFAGWARPLLEHVWRSMVLHMGQSDRLMLHPSGRHAVSFACVR